MICLRDVCKIYNSRKPNEFAALRGVSFDIDAGSFTVIKGPSGSGKTTLLGILGCMARPTSGRVHFRDREITSLPERFLTDIRRNSFGFIFQRFHLIKGITVLENIMLPAYPTGVKRKLLEKRAFERRDIFNLRHKAHSPVEWRSGGEAQRAAIARALINDPAVIIADEPTAHLDSALASGFMDAMLQMKEEGKTIITASHDPLIHSSGYVDRVIEMHDGIVAAREVAA